MSKHDPYSFLRLSQSGTDETNEGVYIARAEYRQQVTLAVRYPLCASAILNIGMTKTSVASRWLKEDKLTRFNAYWNARKVKQGSQALDAINVWHVLDDPKKEKPLILLFALAVGAMPVMQTAPGRRKAGQPERASYSGSQEDFASLTEHDLEVAFQFEHWKTIKRINSLWEALKSHKNRTDPKRDCITIHLRTCGPMESEECPGRTDEGTEVVRGLSVLGDPADATRTQDLFNKLMEPQPAHARWPNLKEHLKTKGRLVDGNMQIGEC